MASQSDPAAELARAIERGFHVDENGWIHAAAEYVAVIGPRVRSSFAPMGAHVDWVGSWLDGDLRPFNGPAPQAEGGDPLA